MPAANRASSFEHRASSGPAAPPRKRGAPLGNLNALKSGRRSKQIKTLITVLLEVPELRATLLQLARKQRRGSLDDLRDAVQHYKRLLELPSRRRSIRSIRRQSSLWRAQVSQTNASLLPSPSGRGIEGEGRRLPRPAASLYNAVVGRIILFDIDMTLLYSGGAGGLSMRRAFHQLYGVEDGFKRVEFSGRTDWSILRNALEQHGLVDGDDGAFARELPRFQQAYYSILEPTLREVTGGQTLPGVPELVAAIAARDGVRRGLATGNFREAAMIKLRHFGLIEYLSEGGFGDDAEERARVVAIAIERVGDSAPAGPVWVIGDTPLDIAAAHANGALALGVATGPKSVDELRAAGADAAVADLSDTAAVLRIVLGT